METEAHLDSPKASPLPESDLPTAWWDEEEISYFFSPFRSYNQNPVDKENKMKFWKPMIMKWCEFQNRCSFTLAELERVFTKDRLVPACLSGVIEDMLRRRQMCAVEDFFMIPPQTWSGWALDLLIKRPVGWSLKKAKEFIIPSENDKCYVLIEAAKFQANILLSEVRENGKGYLLSKTEVENLVPHIRDLDIVLHWLLCQNKIVSKRYKDQELIKFFGNDEKLNTITETDFGIYTLQQTEHSMSQHVEKLECERMAAIESAKSYVAKGMKQMAKSMLRKKHHIEKNLEKKATVLENIQTLLAQIHEAHSDSKILETYQEGIAALKFSMKEANLSEDNVSNTMLELNEILDIQNDIRESMSQNCNENASDQELDEELDKLLLSELPSAPKHTPTPIDLPNVPSAKMTTDLSTEMKKVCIT